MKRTFAFLLSLLMLVGLVPTNSLAAGVDPYNLSFDTSTAYAMVDWDCPDDGTGNVLYDFELYYQGASGWEKVWFQYNAPIPSKGALAIDASLIARQGEGYYKFAVRTSKSSGHGEGNWAESVPVFIDLSGSESRILPPESGYFDSQTNTLSWTNPAGIDDGGLSYHHGAVIEVWYTGERGELNESEWIRVNRYYLSGYNPVSTELHSILYSSLFSDNRVPAGQYAFKVSNFADDYLFRGESQQILLDGRFVCAPEVLPLASGLAWTNTNGLHWELPESLKTSNIRYYEVELMRSEEPLDDPASQWDRLTYEYFRFNEEDLNDPNSLEAAWEENNAKIQSRIERGGNGWYYARVRAIERDSFQNYPSQWAYSEGLQVSTPSPSNLKWHTSVLEIEEDDGTFSYEFFTKYGCIAFERAVDAAGNFADEDGYDIVFLKDGEEIYSGWTIPYWESSPYAHDSSFNFNVFDGSSGTYQFKLRTVSGPFGEDGEWVYSDPWEYHQPDVQLDTPVAPVWNDTDYSTLVSCWEAVGNAGSYTMEYFYAEHEGDTPVLIASHTRYGRTYDNFGSDLDYGDGYYYFRVRANPEDIEAYASSPWSELSSAYHRILDLDEKVQIVQDNLDIIAKYMFAGSDIQRGLSETKYLDTAMAADAAGKTVILDQLAALELRLMEDRSVIAEVTVDDSLGNVFGNDLDALTFRAINLAFNANLDLAFENAIQQKKDHS